MPRTFQSYEIEIEKLVHGGQGIGTLPDGKKAFVWNALPSELVKFQATKKRHDYLEGVAIEILQSSVLRVKPKDELYLSTSPWQILDESYEDTAKHEILTESFNRAKVAIAKELKLSPTTHFWKYRNKMEYSFFGDETGLHLALFNRGTKSKANVSGSTIAMECIDVAANSVLEVLNQQQIRASSLKSLILRANQDNQVVAALFTKDENFPDLKAIPKGLKGFAVVYSNPKSPASVRTKVLSVLGNVSLTDNIRGIPVSYDVFSFFQVNVPVFEQALEEISDFIEGDPAIDFYSGVGSIGLAIPGVSALIESDDNNIAWAKTNTQQRSGIQVIQGKSEDALDYLSADYALIVDPPRAGLHSKVIAEILKKKPPKIAYLSCNPSTQARDLSFLQDDYEIASATCYNFFPRTPHIESLALLVRR